MIRSVVLVMLALTARVAHAGPCGSSRDAVSIALSEEGTEIPNEGGVLVGATAIGFGSQSSAPDAINKSWRFHDDQGGELEPVLVTLAPGLVSYRPPDGAYGTLRLANGNVEIVAVQRTSKELEPLAAPAIARVKRSGNSVVASFKKAAPKGAVALVMLAVTKTGNEARSWASVAAGDKSVAVYQAPGRCEPRIPGMTDARVGERVVFAWVDAHGRLSKPSTALKVSR